MRVYVQKAFEGERVIIVVPGKRLRLAPVWIHGRDKDAVRAEAARVVRDVSLAEAAARVPVLMP